MKRVHKTIHTLQTLHNDIVGLMYDIKELATTYRGNFIALCVGIAVAIFNHNRHNPGMFFFNFNSRSTIVTKYQQDQSTVEETTVGIFPTTYTVEGISYVFCLQTV